MVKIDEILSNQPSSVLIVVLLSAAVAIFQFISVFMNGIGEPNWISGALMGVIWVLVAAALLFGMPIAWYATLFSGIFTIVRCLDTLFSGWVPIVMILLIILTGMSLLLPSVRHFFDVGKI